MLNQNLVIVMVSKIQILKLQSHELDALAEVDVPQTDIVTFLLFSRLPVLFLMPRIMYKTYVIFLHYFQKRLINC